MIRVAGYEQNSIVDGPGVRFTLFMQGCPHHCPGCQNPETWDFGGGKLMSAEDIFAMISADPLVSGVTFSGGEPFIQSHELEPLARMLRDHGYSLWCYTGYLWGQVKGFTLTKLLDVVVDGAYMEECKSLELRFRGSTNQRIIDVQRSLQLKGITLAPYMI